MRHRHRFSWERDWVMIGFFFIVLLFVAWLILSQWNYRPNPTHSPQTIGVMV